MFDTFAISKTFARSPDEVELERIGWKPLRDKRTDKITALYFNSAKGEREPRLTLSKNQNDYWIIRAEVSLPAWLKGSNLELLTESEISPGLSMLSEYVGDHSGIKFDAHTERVVRVDFTRDFQVGENSVLPIIGKFAKLQIPKYISKVIDNKTVYFTNAGKSLTKQYKIYSKYHEALSRNESLSEIADSKGLLRLENLFRKGAVNNLAKSLKLRNHHADNILTAATSEKVIQMAMKRLSFESILNMQSSDIEKLFEICNSTTAMSRIGFLYIVEKYGKDLHKIPFLNISKSTYKRCLSDCRKAGVVSLE